jgi:hypothetical protein
MNDQVPEPTPADARAANDPLYRRPQQSEVQRELRRVAYVAARVPPTTALDFAVKLVLAITLAGLITGVGVAAFGRSLLDLLGVLG